MFIDIHAHITFGNFPEFSGLLGRKPFTVDTLLRRMDAEEIEKSVLLPLINPECLDFYAAAGNQECLAAAKKHPDRLVAFCGIDPRSMMNLRDDGGLDRLLRAYKDLGCLGIGEMCASLPLDDERYQRLFGFAGQEKTPILFHFQPLRAPFQYGALDDLGLPRLEKMSAKFPDTIFIGHSPCFWNELDGGLAEENRNRYVTGAIAQKGKLWELFATRGNLYGDISARSAYVALSRDPKGAEFLETFSDRICFGTDRFTAADEPAPPIIAYLKEQVSAGRLSATAYEKIAKKNAKTLLGI